MSQPPQYPPTGDHGHRGQDPGGYGQGGQGQGGHGQDQGGHGQDQGGYDQGGYGGQPGYGPPPGGYGPPPGGYGPPPGGYGAPQGYGTPQGYGGLQGYGPPQPGPGGEPGGFGPPPPFGRPVPTYLWQSIVVTLLCCLPFGIVAIIYAAQVQGREQIGDVNGARDASRKAKRWCVIALVVGLVIDVLFVVLAGMGGYESNAAGYWTSGPAPWAGSVHL